MVLGTARLSGRVLAAVCVLVVTDFVLVRVGKTSWFSGRLLVVVYNTKTYLCATVQLPSKLHASYLLGTTSGGLKTTDTNATKASTEQEHDRIRGIEVLL